MFVEETVSKIIITQLALNGNPTLYTRTKFRSDIIEAKNAVSEGANYLAGVRDESRNHNG